MLPIEKVQDIIAKHDNLEKELSSGNIDTKLFAKKSKEYSSLGHVILYAREFVKFESEKKDFDSADLIRDHLQKIGIVIKDTQEGTTWEIEKDN